MRRALILLVSTLIASTAAETMGRTAGFLPLLLAAVTAAPLSPQQAQTTAYDLPAKHYGQVVQDAEDRIARTYAGTNKQDTYTTPLEYEKEVQKTVKAAVKSEDATHSDVFNAVVNHVTHLQSAADMGSQVNADDWEKVDASAKSLTRVDEEAENLASTKAFHKRWARFSKKLPKDASEVQNTNPYADLLAQSKKMAEEDTTFAKKQDAALKDMAMATVQEEQADKATDSGSPEDREALKKDAEEARAALDPQFAYDMNPTANVNESPSYQKLADMERMDEQMETNITNKEKQYEVLKKTGVAPPLPQVGPAKKMSKLDMAKELIDSAQSANKAEGEYSKLEAAYDARYRSGVRTKFEPQAPTMTSTPAAAALYKQLKAKHGKRTIDSDLKALKQVQDIAHKEHADALHTALKEAPTQATVAELVQQGAVGAKALQKDMDMQAKLDVENAKSGALPVTVEEAREKSKLLQVKHWQEQTMLKEGQEAVAQAALDVEHTGSAADLAVLNANIQRLQNGKPPLTKAEAHETASAEQEDRTMKHTLSEDMYKSYVKGVNTTSKVMDQDLHSKIVSTEATGDVESHLLPYSGEDDELEPDSVDDPMFSKEVDTYGHSFNPKTYVIEEDDDLELEPLHEAPSAAETEQATDEDEERDQPEDKLSQDAEGSVEAYQEKVAKLPPASPAAEEALDDKDDDTMPHEDGDIEIANSVPIH